MRPLDLIGAIERPYDATGDEAYDHDGKRFILVQDSQVPLTVQKSLTKHEKQAVAFAVTGHSNKLIAYDLGRSIGTVAVLLSRAAKKVGVRGRVALIRAFREQAESSR